MWAPLPARPWGVRVRGAGPCRGPGLGRGDIKQQLADNNSTNLGAQKLGPPVDQGAQGENWLFLSLSPWTPKVRRGWKTMVAHTPRVPDLVGLGGGPESACLALGRGVVWGPPLRSAALLSVASR